MVSCRTRIPVVHGPAEVALDRGVGGLVHPVEGVYRISASSSSAWHGDAERDAVAGRRCVGRRVFFGCPTRPPSPCPSPCYHPCHGARHTGYGAMEGGWSAGAWSWCAHRNCECKQMAI